MFVVMLCAVLSWQLQPTDALPAPPGADSTQRAAEAVPAPRPELPAAAGSVPQSPAQTVTLPAAIPLLGIATLHLDVPNRAKVFLETRTVGEMRASVGTWSRYRHFRVPVRVDIEEPVKVTVQLRKDLCDCRYDTEACNCDHKVVSCCKTVFLRAGDDEYLDFRRQVDAGESLSHLSFVVEPPGNGWHYTVPPAPEASVQPDELQSAPMMAPESAADETPPTRSGTDPAPPIVPAAPGTAAPVEIAPPANG